MSIIENIRNMLFSQGVYEFYLPFLLTFAIFYALIRRTRVFGKDKFANNVSLLVALVASFYVIAFSPAATTISAFFSTFFAATSVFLVTILSLLMITMMLFGPFWTKMADMDWWGDNLKWFIAIGLLITILIFVMSGGVGLFGVIIPPNLGIPGMSAEDVALLVLLIITGAIVFMVAKEGGEYDKEDDKGPDDKTG